MILLISAALALSALSSVFLAWASFDQVLITSLLLVAALIAHLLWRR